MADNPTITKDPRFIPVDREVCEKLLDQLSDPGVRVEKLNQLVCSDPVLLMEMVTSANGLKTVSGGKDVIEGKAALLALGLERIRSLVQELAEVTPHYTGDQQIWLKSIKLRSRKAAAVASLIAQMVRPESMLECFTIGSFTYVGDFVALSHLGERLTTLLDENMRRTKLRYRLEKDYRFSLQEETLSYLASRTVPIPIASALDPDSSKLLPNVQAMKEICLSAAEFVDAFFEDRLERLSPQYSIPPKSYRRMLSLSEERYAELFEMVENYLEKGEFVEATSVAPEELSVGGEDELGEAEEIEIVEIFDDEIEQESLQISQFESEEESLEDIFADEDSAGLFEGEYAKPIEPVARRKYVSKSDQAMPQFVSMFESTESTEDLLVQLLDMLVDQAPFDCAALLVVSVEDRQAQLVALRGRDLAKNGATAIELTDPLSPLLNAKSKVVSYSPKRKGKTPFGCGNYAISPIEAKYKRPVVLYADCGEGEILTFEARRLFRKVVNMLNNVLPQMEGDIPLQYEDTLNSL